MTMAATQLVDLSEPRCWELSATQSVGRLAVSINGAPDVFPVNFAVDDGRLLIRTAPGTKLAAAIGRMVAFEVDVLDPQRRTGWSVVFRGPASEPRHIEDYLQASDLTENCWASGPKDRFIVIEPTSVEGRALPPAVTSVVHLEDAR